MRVAITGSPGVGKHTVAREILNHLEFSLMDINSIAKNAGLFEPAEDTSDVDVVELQRKIEEKISDYVLIVGHLVPYVVPSDRIDTVIVVRRDPYELLDVYRNRGYTEEKSKENAGSEVLGVIAFDTVARFGTKVSR